MTVMLSEILVDWLKHAFITKFNHIRSSVYERYTDVLCRDLSSASATGRKGVRKVGLKHHINFVDNNTNDSFASIPMSINRHL